MTFYNPTRTRDHNYTPAQLRYNPRFIVMADGSTLEADVTVFQLGKQSITGDTATLGYFAHDGKCFNALLKASKKNGNLYWQAESSARLNGIACQKRGHIH